MAVVVRARIFAQAGQPFAVQIDLHGWHGWIPDLQEIPDRFRRIGEAGSGRQSLGQESRAAQCTAWIACETKEVALLRVKELEALQGFDVRILDGYGRDLKRVTLDQVVCAPPRACRGPTIGSTQATFRVDVTLQAELQPDPAAAED